MTAEKIQADNFRLGQGDALLVVDIQNDFLPGGALGIADGDEVVPVLNDYIARFTARALPVFATRDWHTPDHCSFRAQGGIWPVHCVANTRGAEFAPGLALPPGAIVVSKATRQDKEAYSALEGTDLAAQLTALGVKRVFIGGLATDYCVLNTAKDAIKAGFVVVVLCDAIRAVNVKPGDGERAIEEMNELRVRLANLADIAT